MNLRVSKKPLLANATFIEDKQSRIGEVFVDYANYFVFSDVAGTLTIEESNNGTNWTAISTVAVSASTQTETGMVKITKKYFRSKFVNGASKQTEFGLYKTVQSESNIQVMKSNPIDSPVYVSLSSALQAAFDSISVDRMKKGDTATVLNAIVATTTSASIDMTNYKHISVEISASAFTAGNYVVELLGSTLINGTYGPIFKGKDDGTFTQLKAPTVNANGNYTYEFTNIGARYIQVKATRTTDGTLTVKVTPYN